MEMSELRSAAEGPRPDPDTGLEESMWRLGVSGTNSPYPVRPGEQDCSYYMRTGSCGYGVKCRYNHPRDRGDLIGAGTRRSGPVEYLERVDQPVCEYYMKTGTCKFGSACKYHHPKQGGGFIRQLFNDYGYPLRPGEKECSYYMKTGHCKFGSTCKFHHPQHTRDSGPLPAPSFYPPVQLPSVPSTHQYPPMPSWQVSRPSLLPGSYVAGSYAPMLIPSGVVPVQGWSSYQVPMSAVVSHGFQQPIQVGQVYGLANQATPSVPVYPGPQSVSTSVGPSNSSHRGNGFPDRPGQPECQHYMKTGNCKFGATCKYHHPPDWSISQRNYAFSHLGFPLRPGAQICTFYAQHGLCNFGTTCKFDHPMGSLSYSPSASSLSDIPVAPYPIGLSVATLAPSSSSSELRTEFSSSKESLSTKMLSENTPSDSTGSAYTNRGILPHSSVQPQASMSSSTHDSEVSSSS